MEEDKVAYELGKIHSTLEGLSKSSDKQGTKIDGFDKRLTSIQVDSAKRGGYVGAASGGIIALSIEFIKVKMGIGGA